MDNLKQKHIFVVDDNEMFTQLLSDHLTENPLNKVFTFLTGEACLNNLYLNPDIIILDYYLNDVSKDAADGLEILSEIKKHSSSTHVIMLSAQEKYWVALQSISKGAEHYVIKDDDAFKKIDSIIKEIR